MTFERFYDRADDPRVLREITDQIMFELRELSGQEYVNAYAKRKGTEEGAAAAEEAKITAAMPSSNGGQQSPTLAAAG